MIIGIEDGVVVTLFTWAKATEDVAWVPKGMTVTTGPDHVRPGWRLEDGEFVPPNVPEMAYDILTDLFYPHDRFREMLHERTSNDTLQALRKIREGDTAIDWNAWLEELDAYNVAIEKTKEQADYPLKVIYPEYPTKPTR